MRAPERVFNNYNNSNLLDFSQGGSPFISNVHNLQFSNIQPSTRRLLFPQNAK